jgi:hypothetical protein
MPNPVESLSAALELGTLLELVRQRHGGYELLEHWKQGEFHHDIVLRVSERRDLPGGVLVVSTNCNGGVKEIACFAEPPSHDALWHERCPDIADFSGEPPPVLASARTPHWFDPAELLTAEARSEIRPEFRQRQRGGGWERIPD